MSKNKKGYSKYENPKREQLNKKPVKKGSVIVANLSDYEKLPKNVVDHKRESVVAIKDSNDELGVVYLHGKNDLTGNFRVKKKEAGLWEKIKKDGQEVYVDIDIKVKDAKGNPIKQGKVFKNTGVILDEENMQKVEDHIYKNKKRSHSIRERVAKNKAIKEKKTK